MMVVAMASTRVDLKRKAMLIGVLVVVVVSV